MFHEEFAALASRLAQADPAVCDRDELAHLVTTSQKARGWLDALDARIALRAAELADQDGGDDPESVLSGGGRRSARDAGAAARRGDVCVEMPSVHDALAGGEVSAGHVDALARLSGSLDDAGRSELKTLESALVTSAKQRTVEEFGRECRDLERILAGDEGTSRLERQKRARRLKRWIDRTTGMCHTHLELDPESDAKVSAALGEAIAAERSKADGERTWEQLQADALVGLITGARSLDRRVPELSVLIDHETLVNGLHERSVCETADGNPLPPETVRRLGCDADILPVVLGAGGEPLDVGRARRLATRAQRRALRAMYRTCAHPRCTVTFEACRIHHVQWWEHNGPTDIANLLPLCSAHHRLVHEGAWALALAPDRTITLHRPDGSLYFEGSTVDRTTPAEPSTMRRARAHEEQHCPEVTRRRDTDPDDGPAERTDSRTDETVDLFTWRQPVAAAPIPPAVASTITGRSRPPPRTPAA
jgi:hypothetical protein